MTTSKVEIAAELSMHRERINIIDKNNKHVKCPMCKDDDVWEHLMMFDKNKQIKDE